MAETWVINENYVNEDITAVVNFTSNNTSFSKFDAKGTGRVNYIKYDDLQVAYLDIGYLEWIDLAYRTVYFPEPPTGALRTWLQANAVKQETGYSITYHANGGTPTPTDLTGQTNLPNPLPTVSKADFSFAGWYRDSTFQTPAVAGAEISADTDLYAKFTRSLVTLDLSTIGLPEGTHSIQMKLSDDGVTKRDSELSNAVEYTVEPAPQGETKMNIR